MPKFFLLIFLLIWLFGCKSNKSGKKELDIDIYPDTNTLVDNSDYVQKAKFIFYNMSSPVEMGKIFKNSGTTFNQEILFNENQYSFFEGSENIALALGVYGVDLSYANIFQQNQLSIQYLSAIKKLSQKLGVPNDFITVTTSGVKNNINNRDTLFKIANDAYNSANTYLKGNERETTATLILLGGWIETIYIACEMTNNKNYNRELTKKIYDQKYALNSLISLLKGNNGLTQHNDLIQQLEAINPYFQESDNFDFDPISEPGLPAELNAEPFENLKSIKNIITKLRNSITL